jgi:beta-glucosidase
VSGNFKEEARRIVSEMTLGEKCAQMRYQAPAIERLGVRAYNWWNEALHGVARSGVATVFPQAIAMAATFDPDLLYRVASAISDEGRAKYNEYKKTGSTGIYEGLTFWSPNINIFRDPRWGRGHETYGEDPYLTGVLGAAFVRGIQGDPTCRYRKADATLKHYAVHSGPEGGRHSFDARVTQRDLYGTYLRAFRYCIKNADPSAVMGAYNRVSVEGRFEGEPCCASPSLLGEILYKEFGFDGYVVSDCGAITDIHAHHHVTENAAESSALAVKAGCALNCGGAYAALVSAVAAGLLTEEEIDKCVTRLFEARYRLGMFAPEGECPYDSIPFDVVDCAAHRSLNLEAARKTVVLCKNDGILPIDPRSGMRIAVIGPNADDRSVLVGNYNGTPSETITILEGMRAKFGGVRYAPGSHMWRKYNPEDCFEHLLNDAVAVARSSDVVVLVCGLNPTMEGEEGDAYNGASSGDKTTLELPAAQLQLYEAVTAVGKPIVFVNVSGSAIDLSRMDAECAAVLQVFYPGALGGLAVAEVISGEVNPSGRLPVTFYRSDDDLPPFEDYNMRAGKGRTYRYFTGEPLYPFGHGFSYTNFTYSQPSVPATLNKGEGACVSVKVKNTGLRAGDEIVTAYVSRPDVEGTPIKELASVARVSLVPGDEKEVSLKIDAEAFGVYGEDGALNVPSGAAVIEVGGYKACVEII